MADLPTTKATPDERERALAIIETESDDLTQAAARRRVSYNWLRSRVQSGAIASFTVGQQIRVWRDLESA
jgi:hypothetical protein